MRNKPDLRHYSRKAIASYLRRFLKERMGVLYPRDIEPLHRMRVASRRLRVALRVFKGILPVKKNRIWRKEIQKIGKALGGARELDVQIQFLRTVKNKLRKESYVANAEKIINAFQKERRKAQKQIDATLLDFETEKRLPGLEKYLNKSSCAPSKIRTDAFLSRAGKIILEQLNTLLSFLSYVYKYKPHRKKELHRMRITAKRLRYTLEICRPWYGPQLDKYIRACRDIQDTLGDLHEFDLLAEALTVFSKKEDGGFNNTIAYLVAECAKLRKEAYAKFVRIWKHAQERRLWEKLRKVV